MLIVSAEEMRRLDNMAQQLGVPALLLMENAGRALADHAERLLAGLPFEGLTSCQAQAGDAVLPARLPKKQIAILAGPGQNGGDGFCAARHLAARGHEVKVGFFGKQAKLPEEAHMNYQMLASYPVEVYPVETMSPQEVLDALGHPDLIIDALLGIGGQGDPRSPMDMAIRWANSQDAPVVACDIPSGLSADTGYAYSPCIQADLTITMGFAKIGLLSYPGRMYTGHLIVEKLSFPPGMVVDYHREGGQTQAGLPSQAQADGPITILAKAASMEQAARLMPVRRGDHHKGVSGHVVVVAGCVGMAGAGVLAAKSALRAGAGTVTLICPGGAYNACAGAVPEVMVVPCGESGVFCPSKDCIEVVRTNLERAAAVVLGPGWGRGDFQTQFLKEILPIASKKTCVIDADALFALRQLGGFSYLAGLQGNFILTPHPGEMSVLTGLSAGQIQKDRPGYARQGAHESNSVVCLKGAGTCTAGPSGQLCVNTSGGPYMATAGSGDVLTGVIAALAAQGLPPYESAWLGVFWHGLAGEAAFRRKGAYGILAGDIIECLPEARALIGAPETN